MTPPMPAPDGAMILDAGGERDGAVCRSDGGTADLCSDPIVGRPCGPGNFCPCGYFCPIDRCEVADFHPPCGDMK